MSQNPKEATRGEYRRLLESIRICDRIKEDLREGLIIDDPKGLRESERILENFKTLFNTVIRDLGYTTAGYIRPGQCSEVPDWFDSNRRGAVGTS